MTEWPLSGLKCLAESTLTLGIVDMRWKPNAWPWVDWWAHALAVSPPKTIHPLNFRNPQVEPVHYMSILYAERMDGELAMNFAARGSHLWADLMMCWRIRTQHSSWQANGKYGLQRSTSCRNFSQNIDVYSWDKETRISPTCRSGLFQSYTAIQAPLF